MSDLFDETEAVPAAAPAEEAKPVRKKPGRPRKAKAGDEGEKKPRVTIKRKTKVAVVKSAEKPEERTAEAVPEVQAEAVPPAEETPADIPASDEMPAETAADSSSENEEGAEETQAEKTFERRYDDRFHNNGTGRRDKRMKNNGKRRVPEDYQPEINMDEHPDAPQLFISVLTALHIDELRDRAKNQGIPEDVILDSRKSELIAKMLRLHSANGGVLLAEGTLEVLQEGSFGYLRYPFNNYLAGTEDVYVSASLIKAIGMKTGDLVYAQIRAPRENEKSAAVVRVLKVNSEEPKMAKIRGQSPPISQRGLLIFSARLEKDSVR